jgi:hypothetical protein
MNRDRLIRRARGQMAASDDAAETDREAADLPIGPGIAPEAKTASPAANP